MKAEADPQTRAAEPQRSVFVTANAGSGKTTTLVNRVARLLIAGAGPQAILCVTFTKAAAAEMQRRLFKTLGDWAVMEDAALRDSLAAIGEAQADLNKARALFARALETPGGLKIQTIHAFCEALLRRFPLEAGLSPAFTVLDDMAVAEISARAKAAVAQRAGAAPGSPLARAYGHLSVALDWRSFEALFVDFQARRGSLSAYFGACEARGGYLADTWGRCGFEREESVADIEGEALGRIRWRAWREAMDELGASEARTDQLLLRAMAAAQAGGGFAAVREVFCTAEGEARRALGTVALSGQAKDWLKDEQARCLAVCERLKAARIAQDTVAVLTLASAYLAAYADAKARRQALDFSDIIERSVELLSVRADAAWVLYKLDGGIEHVLLDEAQDTAPEQWVILRTLTAEFFTGLGAQPRRRTVFAVGDLKQSIFSFQGAAPEQVASQRQELERAVSASGQRFDSVDLKTSFRSRPEILELVDAVGALPQVLAGLSPSAVNVSPLPSTHIAVRAGGGCAELWPLERKVREVEVDVWAPVDSESALGPGRRLAERIAREIRAAVARGDGVGGREGTAMRPCRWGDFLILVRRRNALFHEVIRALKREGAPVAGADRFRLSEHGVHDDLMAVGRVARFAWDDLSLAGLMRGPFCDVSEDELYELAHGRRGSLWGALIGRQEERAAWSAAADLVHDVRVLARGAPFEFYARFLSRLDGEGRSMRQRLMTRMGIEGEEALLAFLTQALEAERRGVREVETFLSELALFDVEIKREQEQAGEEGEGPVRVMTVHGAKGLEAPIVILPDTTVRATDQGADLFETADGGFLFAPRSTEDCPASALARRARCAAVERESARLLYVALTRARDRLIIAGVETADHWRTGSWRDCVEQAFDTLGAQPFEPSDGAPARRFGPPPLAAAAPSRPLAAHAEPPAWTRRAAAQESGAADLAAPSSWGGAAGGPAPSPLQTVAGLGRYRRGEVIHRLLQMLPDLPGPEREAAAERLLAREGDLTEAQRREMRAASFAVLEDGRFAAVFGPGSRAEVAIAGGSPRLPPGMRISGRLDRLLVEADRVLVVDFKTNRPPPATIAAADPAYVRQMALYWAVLGAIFPDRRVEAALLWTDGPTLMTVPENLIIEALNRIATPG